MVERYMKDGKVAVIYSPSFGAGWSHANSPEWWWSDDRQCPTREELLFDATLAKMIDGGCPRGSLVEYAEAKWGEDISTSGLFDAELAWLDPGTQFVVLEYDGAESIKLASELVNVA